MQKKGAVNLPLHGGHPPKWLFSRMVKAGIIFIIQLIGGCEQPEITHQKTLIDSLQINTNDEINDWDTDTTTYHTTTKPTK